MKLKNYYTIPLDIKSLIDKKKHNLCDLRESVQMNIHLIIKTNYKECRYDNSYGCMIWNKDYSTIDNVSNWKDELKSLIHASIEKNEPRLAKINVALRFDEGEVSVQSKKQSQRLKKKISIYITGVLKFLNEPFEHYEYLFFSPLSVG